MSKEDLVLKDNINDSSVQDVKSPIPMNHVRI